MVLECSSPSYWNPLQSNTTLALQIKYINLYSDHTIQYLLIFFWVFKVEFGVMSHWQIYTISGSLIHHFGHSLTYNFLCRIPQIKSQCMIEYYHAMKFREIPDSEGSSLSRNQAWGGVFTQSNQNCCEHVNIVGRCPSSCSWDCNYRDILPVQRVWCHRMRSERENILNNFAAYPPSRWTWRVPLGCFDSFETWQAVHMKDSEIDCHHHHHHRSYLRLLRESYGRLAFTVVLLYVQIQIVLFPITLMMPWPAVCRMTKTSSFKCWSWLLS